MTPRQIERMKPKRNWKDLIIGIAIWGLIFLIASIAGASDSAILNLMAG